MLRVGVKYCGGCNPEYDRVILVEQIMERLEEKISFVPSESEEVDVILSVHGCKTACADLSDFRGTRIWNVTDIEEGEKFVGEIIEKEVYVNARNEK